MSAKLQLLNKEIGDVADRLSAIVANPQRSAQDEAELDTLTARSETLRSEIEREEGIQKKVAELRAVTDRCSPVKEERKVASDIQPIPFSNRRLRAFTGDRAEERAYRAGQFYLGYVFGNENAKRWCRDHGLEARAQAEGSEYLGGSFLVPEVLSQIITLVEQYGTFPAYAKNVTMSTEVLSVPRRVGGLVANFIDENAATPDSDAQWDRVNLVARKLGVANRISTELLQDSIVAIADVITEEIGRAIAFKIDAVGWNGNDGEGEGGVVGVVPKLATCTASNIYAPSGELGFESFSLDTLIKVTGHLPLYARQSAAWYVSPAGYAATMQRLMLASGGTRPMDVAGAGELSFMGYPVRLVNVLDGTLGNDGGKLKIVFGDLAASTMLGTRRAMSMRVSDQRYVELDQVLMLATTRIAVNVHDTGSNVKKGPLVGLFSYD